MTKLLSLWSMIEKYFKAYAGEIGEELILLTTAWHAMRADPARASTSPDSLKLLKDHATVLKGHAVALGLGMSENKATALLFYLDMTPNPQDLIDGARDLIYTLKDELHSIAFLPVTEDMGKYHGLDTPFGSGIGAAFPESEEDISEAHECIAFERYTAAMFHLGRAMELAVKRVAKKMKVKAHRDEWQSYLTAMNEHIANMPFKTPKDKATRAVWAEAAAYLMHFKEAWRNQTMHPKKTYTRNEALTVLDGAKAFLEYAATKIFKVKF